MLIILRGVRCPLILKTGSAKGVPLEQLILEPFAEEFIKRVACLRGLGGLIKKIGACGGHEKIKLDSTVRVLNRCRFAYNPCC